MNRYVLRGLASGILLTTVLFGYLYVSGTFIDTSLQVSEDPLTVDEMIVELEKEGYYVSVEAPIANPPTEETVDERPNHASPESVTVYTTVLRITSGMTSRDVAKQLVRGQIIEDEQAFLNYMQSTNRNKIIRTGEYEIRSNMSVEEIADIIS
ncbi:endolytic transglycosylase MltG [Halalkalibacter urbisdiaboli]|uniref:endolytic transglycosylase MltG n=1 Tax=Halalkalibacter urbisdiaboli TaxID=1960589 RepID=UPI000B42FDA2|nr:endolytic transglycosylase MltG [Halalkalibacter urbisdiaboli]